MVPNFRKLSKFYVKNKIFLKVATSSFAKSSARFTGHLYKETTESTQDNIALTPLAIQGVLGVVRKGAKEGTAQEIKKALSFNQNPIEIENVIKDVHQILNQGQNFKYLSANKIYLGKSYPIRKDFKTLSKEVFLTELELLASSKLKECVDEINDHVKKQTGNCIDSFLDESIVERRNKMICTSATYFKVVWSRFQKESSFSRREFHTPSETIQIEFLEKNGYFNYCESPVLRAKIVEIPIENLLDLVLVLPQEIDGLSIAENQFIALFRGDHKYKEERVSVVIPKFRLDFLMDLKKILQNLGMKKAFTSDGDLTGFIAEKQGLFINHVFTKTVISFNEDTGSYGAIGPVRSTKQFTSTFKEFTADHPFILYIKAKDIIVFAGRVVKPE